MRDGSQAQARDDPSGAMTEKCDPLIQPIFLCRVSSDQQGTGNENEGGLYTDASSAGLPGKFRCFRPIHEQRKVTIYDDCAKATDCAKAICRLFGLYR